jgi:hypothetical protein
MLVVDYAQVMKALLSSDRRSGSFCFDRGYVGVVCNSLDGIVSLHLSH